MIDEHDACLREMRRIDTEWRDRLHKVGSIARVLVLEGDQHGTWERVAMVTRVEPTAEGLVIWVR